MYFTTWASLKITPSKMYFRTFASKNMINEKTIFTIMNKKSFLQNVLKYEDNKQKRKIF